MPDARREPPGGRGSVSRRRGRWRLVLPLALLVGACSNTGGSPTARSPVVLRPGAADHAVLNGSGSTLAANVVNQWAQQYRAIAPGVTINFRAEDARTATAELQSGTVDFGVSESPALPAARIDIAAVPSAATAVVVAYNLPGVPALRLSAPTLAGIFGGSITSWESPEIAADNPGVALPNAAVAVLNRADPSGATLVLSQFLQGSAPGRWTVGSGATVAWPVGTPVTGDAAMTAAVTGKVGAIGYTSADEAGTAGLRVAMIKNAAGKFSTPTADSIDTFLLSAVGTPDDLDLKVGYDNPAPVSYPLSAFTYMLVPKAPPTSTKDVALRNFLQWALSEGQGSTERVRAAPLPLPLMVRTLEALQSDDLRPKR